MSSQFKIIVNNPEPAQCTAEQDEELRKIILKKYPDIEEMWLDIFYKFSDDEPGVEVEDPEDSIESLAAFEKIIKRHFGQAFNCSQE